MTLLQMLPSSLKTSGVINGQWDGIYILKNYQSLDLDFRLNDTHLVQQLAVLVLKFSRDGQHMLILTFFVVTLCEHESKLRGRHTCMLMHHLVPAQLINLVSGAIVYVSLKMLWVLDDAKDYRDIQMGDYGSITICQRVADGCPQWLEKGLSSLFC